MSRIVVEDWSREQAIAEMESHGFHKIWSDIPRYLRDFDINAMRSR